VLGKSISSDGEYSYRKELQHAATARHTLLKRGGEGGREGGKEDVIPSDIKHHHAYPTYFELPRLVQSLTPALPPSLPPSSSVTPK